MTWSINSICHFFGAARFETGDHSTNVFWLALPEPRRGLAPQPPRLPALAPSTACAGMSSTRPAGSSWRCRTARAGLGRRAHRPRAAAREVRVRAAPDSRWRERLTVARRVGAPSGGAMSTHPPPRRRQGPVKPRLRGVSHQWGFVVSLGAGAALIAYAPARPRGRRGGDLRRRRLGAARHEHALSPRQLAPDGAALDAAAGPLDDLRADRRELHAVRAARNARHARDGRAVVVWAGALGGIVLQLWADHPKWVAVVVSIALGWVAVATLTPAARGDRLGGGRRAVVSGALYTAGAVDLRARAAQPEARRVRLPRGLPRARCSPPRRSSTRRRVRRAAARLRGRGGSRGAARASPLTCVRLERDGGGRFADDQPRLEDHASAESARTPSAVAVADRELDAGGHHLGDRHPQGRCSPGSVPAASWMALEARRPRATCGTRTPWAWAASRRSAQGELSVAATDRRRPLAQRQQRRDGDLPAADRVRHMAGVLRRGRSRQQTRGTARQATSRSWIT